jgi:ribulose-phosphate 3-epimerase
MKVSVSYLNVKKKYINDVICDLDKTTADFIHVDVMDGKYVKNKANSFSDIKDIGYYTRKRLDIHFMVNKPLKVIDDYAMLNVFCMTFHLNIKNELDEVINRCRKYGIKVGLALNPEDDIELIIPYIDKIDLVLVMSVHPGLPGQKFIKESIPKIKALRKMIKEEKRNILISVDGGINLENKDFLGDADILVSGSCITNSDNYEYVINELKG